MYPLRSLGTLNSFQPLHSKLVTYAIVSAPVAGAIRWPLIVRLPPGDVIGDSLLLSSTAPGFCHTRGLRRDAIR